MPDPFAAPCPRMIIDPLEVELKLELDPDAMERFADASVLDGLVAKPTDLISIYFDTPDQDLRKRGFALRIRRKGRTHIQTVKAEGEGAAGLFVRPEWECEVKGDKPMLDASAGPLVELLPPEVLDKLAPLFETRIRRTVFEPVIEGATIELALDKGETVASRRHAPLNEIELELRSGSSRALFDLARRLNDHAPVRLGVRSKAERGYRLAMQAKEKPVKAEPIALDRAGNTRDVFVTIAHACIRQFRLNEGLLLESGAPEAVHQARVGLRRLRSAFSLFKPLLEHDGRSELLRLELKWLAADLGKLRNIDVLIPRMPDAVREQLNVARGQALESVRTQLDSARTRLLMIDLAEWLAIGDWRLNPADPRLAARLAPDFAANVLEKYRKRIKRRGKHLTALDDAHRHEVRIEGKKLRYAAEFFASLYPGRKAQRRQKAFLLVSGVLQDMLGEMNDLVVGPAVLAALGIEAELLRPSEKERHGLLEEAEDALGMLLDIKRFW